MQPDTSADDYRHLVGGDAAEFQRCFNKYSFMFSHQLASHPLLQLPRIIELAADVKRHPEARQGEIYFDCGDIKVDQRWDATPRTGLEDPVEALRLIETCGAWMLIRRAELIPAYKVMLDECLAEVQRLARVEIGVEMLKKNAIVFITSPNRLTTYHIDRECNFLLQISGDKSISIFDRNDRDVLPDVELERYWAVDNNAALYKPHLQDRAKVYHMTPGTGVHIPVNCPHWVRNGATPSVSLSINFQYVSRKRSDVYRANYYLRRIGKPIGFKPRPPGESALVDEIKRRALPALRQGGQIKGKIKGELRARFARLTGRPVAT